MGDAIILLASGEPGWPQGVSPFDWSDETLCSPIETADSLDLSEGGIGMVLADGVNKPVLDIDETVAVFAVDWAGVFDALPFLDG